VKKKDRQKIKRMLVSGAPLAVFTGFYTEEQVRSVYEALSPAQKAEQATNHAAFQNRYREALNRRLSEVKEKKAAEAKTLTPESVPS
jgi:thioredoxin-like negative regulator of GroEL